MTARFGNPPEVRIEERPEPEARAGASLVRVRAATLNQLSNTIRTGGLALSRAPLVLTNEGAGAIESSARLSPAHARRDRWRLRGVTTDGMQQQFVVVKDEQLVPLPATLSWDEGAALTVNYLTADLALTGPANLQEGQTALISRAARGLGHALVQTTAAVGGRSDRRGLLRGEGAARRAGGNGGRDRPVLTGASGSREGSDTRRRHGRGARSGRRRTTRAVGERRP